MNPRRLACSFFFLLVLVLHSAAQNAAPAKTVAERLGYPADAKLVIIHADDLAVAHSVDAASFDALDKGAVTSASIMVPCPWLTEVAEYWRTHPDADLGLHLTLNAEWKTYRWGPVASKDSVSSLMDSDGTLWSSVEKTVMNGRPQEAEREIRAQIDRVLAMGMKPTHLDSHMGTLFASPDFFAAYVRVAHDYKLPFLAVRVNDERAKFLSLLSDKDVVVDSVVIAGMGMKAEAWKDFYLNAIKSLKPGLTYLIVHLGHDDAELQAVTVDHPDYGAAWRQRDYDMVNSAEFKKALADNHVVLVKWKDLQKIVYGQ